MGWVALGLASGLASGLTSGVLASGVPYRFQPCLTHRRTVRVLEPVASRRRALEASLPGR